MDFITPITMSRCGNFEDFQVTGEHNRRYIRVNHPLWNKSIELLSALREQGRWRYLNIRKLDGEGANF